MKNRSIYTLALICLLAILSSCFQTGRNENKILTDSLIRATEKIAIGKANFGISEKEFNLLFPDSLVDLDGNKYIVSSYFDSEGGLEKVYMIDKATFDNQKFDNRLFERMDLIKQYFMSTYGEPKKDRGYPVQQKMLNGNVFESCTWEVGIKRISVGIALEKTYRGNIYYVLSHVDRKDSATRN
ncbi:hypothetical protein GCM10022289_44820 [Pedobacter jeongneungensis]|uniref:Lipoprotein n=1 Tax=Pedobacter jeongneungensis TaxID=947309 RepID=A0ABP8BQ01_9SPHI